jgi:hypothetical protein
MMLVLLLAHIAGDFEVTHGSLPLDFSRRSGDDVHRLSVLGEVPVFWVLFHPAPKRE